MAEHKRFRIIWRNAAYYVSIPEYNGGEVVDAESYDALLSDLESLRKGIERLERHNSQLLMDLTTLEAENQLQGDELDRLRKALEWLENNWTCINHYMANDGAGMFWHYIREDGFLSKGHENSLLATVQHAIANNRALNPQPTEAK